MYNFYFQHDDFVVLSIPRCGSESLADGMHIYPLAAKAFARVLVFVRDPIERCISGYQFFQPFPIDPRSAPTWEAWVDRILDAPEGRDYADQAKSAGRIVAESRHLPVDPHWKPQAQLIDEAPVAVTEVWAFEQLATVIPGIKHFHKSTVQLVDRSYRSAELLAYYARDTALRLTAHGI